MRWQQTEFIFKGMYLGMLLFVGLVLREPDWWREMAQVGVCTFGTLALFLAVAGFRKVREGYSVKGRWGTFVLFLLLENPGMVYAGVLLGMLLGAYSLLSDEELEYRLVYCVAGGAALGVLFNVLYHIYSQRLRRWLGAALGAGLAAGAIYALSEMEQSPDARMTVAVLLLLGIPLFYLLTLASMTEESEVEI